MVRTLPDPAHGNGARDDRAGRRDTLAVLNQRSSFEPSKRCLPRR
jgi:hypothetical protein